MHRIAIDRLASTTSTTAWELRQAADIAAALDLPLDALLPQDIAAPYQVCRDTDRRARPARERDRIRLTHRILKESFLEERRVRSKEET